VREAMNALHVLRHMGLPRFESPAAAAAHAHRCLALFAAWAPLMAQQAPRDLAVGEDVAAFAADALVAAHRLAPASPAPLLQAAAALHAASQARGHSAAIQFALSGLLGVLGAPVEALRAFAALEVRQVQLDTLSHHVVPFLAAAAPSDGARHLADVAALRSLLLSSAGDALADCYANSTFSKVLEFTAFQRREGGSLTFTEAAAEAALLALRRATLGGAALSDAQSAIGAAMRSAPLEAAAAVPARFVNDDLQQLPVWLPPAATPGALAVLRWWAGREGAPPPLPPWWHLPDAATGSSDEATLWRVQRRSAVQMRALQPTLLAGVEAWEDRGGGVGERGWRRRACPPDAPALPRPVQPVHPSRLDAASRRARHCGARGGVPGGSWVSHGRPVHARRRRRRPALPSGRPQVRAWPPSPSLCSAATPLTPLRPQGGQLRDVRAGRRDAGRCAAAAAAAGRHEPRASGRGGSAPRAVPRGAAA